jgi:hypothetical protein
MDARQLALAYDTIKAALATLDDLHVHRMGRHSAEDMHEELQAIRSGLAMGNGLLLPQMRTWFDVESMRKELGNLQTIMMIVEKSLDKEVRSEINSEGYSANKTFIPIERALQSIEGYRSALDQHEKLMKGAQQGARLSVQELASLEDTLLRFTELEERVIAYGETAVKRIEPVRKTFSKQPRKGLSRIAAGFILPIAAAAASMFGGQVYGQDIVKSPTAIVQTEKTDELTDAEIANQMQKETVEDILKGANVEYVQRVENDTNFDALVYQKNLKSEDKKPVLVFFYRNKDPPNWPTPGSAHRTAIVFKKLSRNYGDRIKFVCLNLTVHPKGEAEIRAKYDITALPSIAMYSSFDVVIGETPSKNNGNHRRIDIRSGGPGKDSGIQLMHDNLVQYWIGPNLLNLPNPDKDGKIYRYNNSPKLTVAGIVVAKQ